ncbi:MAG: TrbC/VirB2 family protein [Sphaerochaeta sp.]|nr:TrbC/VirB2 family protein [Sphaerochaeta sp.]
MKKLTKLSTAGAVCMAWLSSQAHAASDPFKEGTELAKSITGSLTGDIAAAVLTLIIVITGYAWWVGKASTTTALRIAGGSILVACAAGIAAMVFK